MTGATWVIARREFRALTSSRAFLFGTLIGVLAIVGLSFLPGLLARLEQRPPLTVAVADEAGGIFEQLQAAERQLPPALRPPVVWQRVTQGPSDLADAPDGEGPRGRAAGGAGATLFIRRGADGELEFVMRGRGLPGSVVRGLQQLATPVAVADRARRWGIVPDLVPLLQAPARVRVETGEAASAPAALGAVEGAAPGDPAGEPAGTEMLAMLLMLMLYMTLTLYGSVVANGVAAEKGSRVVEMLLVAARPGDLLRGKLLGIAGGSLVQYGAWGATGGLVFLLQRGVFRDYLTRMVGVPVELGGVPLWLVGYLALFFLLGFLSFGALFAASASLASRPEEASQTVWPPIVLIVAGYMLAVVSLADPASRVAVIGSMLPFVGPLVIYTRIAMASAPAWEIVGSVVVSLVTAWLTLRLAERVYRASLLETRRTGWAAVLRRGSAIR